MTMSMSYLLVCTSPDLSCRFDMEQAVLVYRHHLEGTQIHTEGLEQQHQQQQQLMV